MKILINNIKNHKYFDIKYVTRLCEYINKKTQLIEFIPIKAGCSEYGLRYVSLKTKYKESKHNSSCKLILSENSKGDIRINSRKGFIISFIPDISLFQKTINQQLMKETTQKKINKPTNNNGCTPSTTTKKLVDIVKGNKNESKK